MLFPIDELMDEGLCYQFLLGALHPAGLCCPAGHPVLANQTPHDRHREPLVDWRCLTCGKVFNLFSGTPLQGIRYALSRLVMILRGFCQGVPTRHLARELEASRRNLLKLRHRVQALVYERFPLTSLEDEVTEADEMYQNAGEKGRPHRDPEDPPRRRANKHNGHGTFDNDRPPILGVIGRETEQVVLRQTYRSTRKALEPVVLGATLPGAAVHTDEWHAYDHLDDQNREHSTVNHRQHEWARDDDGDGIREVHCNTIEGHWTGLRNFLRPFRGVSKWFLNQYVSFYQCLHNFQDDFTKFLRMLLGRW